MPPRSHQEASGDVWRPIFLKFCWGNEAATAAKTSGHLLHIILGHGHCGGVGAQRIEIILIIVITISLILVMIMIIISNVSAYPLLCEIGFSNSTFPLVTLSGQKKCA